MNPYREAFRPISRAVRRRWRRVSLRRRFCALIAVLTIAPYIFQQQANDGIWAARPAPADTTYPTWLLLIGVLSLLVAALPVSQHDAKARMCRILWNRGERGTAFGVYIGWVPLHFSEKRLERNARMLARFVERREREQMPWVRWFR